MSEGSEDEYEFCKALHDLKGLIKEYLDADSAQQMSPSQMQALDQISQKVGLLDEPKYFEFTETQKYDVSAIISVLSLVQILGSRTEDFDYQLARYLDIICEFGELGTVVASAAVSVVRQNFKQFERIFDRADEHSAFLHLLHLFNDEENEAAIEFIQYKFQPAQISALCASSGSTAARAVITEKLQISEFEQNDLNLILESIILYFLNFKEEVPQDFETQFYDVLYNLAHQLEDANEHFVRALDLLYERVFGVGGKDRELDILTDIIISINNAPKWLSVTTCYSIMAAKQNADFAANCRDNLLALYEQLFPMHLTDMLKAEFLMEMPRSSTKLDSDLQTMLYTIVQLINRFEKSDDEDISTADFVYRMLKFEDCGDLVELFELKDGVACNRAAFAQFIQTPENQRRMEDLYNNFMQFEYFALNLEFGILPPQDFLTVFEQMNFPLVLLTKALKSAITGFEYVRYAASDNDDYIKKKAFTQLLAFFDGITTEYDKFHFGKNILKDFIGACFEFNDFLRELDTQFEHSHFIARLFAIVKDANCRDEELFALQMIREIPESFIQPYFLDILPEMQRICSSDPSQETIEAVIQIIENMCKVSGIDVVGTLVGLQQERGIEFLHFAVNFLQGLKYDETFTENFYKIMEVFVVGVFTAESEQEVTALNHILMNLYHFQVGWFINCCIYTMINRKCKKFGKIIYGLENMVLEKPKIIISHFDYALLEQLLNCNQNTDIVVMELLFKVMNSHAILECSNNKSLEKEAQEDLTREVCADLTNLFVEHYKDSLSSDLLLFKIFCQQINMLDVKFCNKTFTSAKFYYTVLNQFMFLCNEEFYILASSLQTGVFDDGAYADLLTNGEIYNTDLDYLLLPCDIYRPELTDAVGVTPVDVTYLLNSCTDVLCRNDEDSKNIIEFERENLLDLLRLALELALCMKLETKIRHSAVELIYQLSQDVLSVITIARDTPAFWANEFPKLTDLPERIAEADVEMAVNAACNMTEIISLATIDCIVKMNQTKATKERAREFYHEFSMISADERTQHFENISTEVMNSFVSALANDWRPDDSSSDNQSNLKLCIEYYSGIAPRIAQIEARREVTPALLLEACIFSSLNHLGQGSFQSYVEYLKVAEDLLLSLEKISFPDILVLARFVRWQIGEVVAESQTQQNIVYQAWQIMFYSEVLRFTVNLENVLNEPNGKLAVLELFKSMLAEDDTITHDESALVNLAVNTYLLVCPIDIDVLHKIIAMLGVSIVQECVRHCCVFVLRCYDNDEPPPLPRLQIGQGAFEPRYLEKESTGDAQNELQEAYKKSAECIMTLFAGEDDDDLSTSIVKFLEYDLTAREILPLQQALAASLPLSRIQGELYHYEEQETFSPVVGHYYARHVFSNQDVANFEAFMSRYASKLTFSSLICAFYAAVVLNSKRAAATIFEAVLDCDDVEVERQYGLILKIIKFCQSDARWWTLEPAFDYHIDLIQKYCEEKEQVFLSRELMEIEQRAEFAQNEVFYMFSIRDQNIEFTD